MQGCIYVIHTATAVGKVDPRSSLDMKERRKSPPLRHPGSNPGHRARSQAPCRLSHMTHKVNKECIFYLKYIFYTSSQSQTFPLPNHIVNIQNFSTLHNLIKRFTSKVYCKCQSVTCGITLLYS